MLQNLDRQIRECLQHAADCANREKKTLHTRDTRIGRFQLKSAGVESVENERDIPHISANLRHPPAGDRGLSTIFGVALGVK
jgi:hypothetical protein